MTSYVKLYPAQITDGRWAGANKAAFSVHMAAISYCDEHNADQKSDGRISRHDALRLKAPCVSPEEMPLAIKSLLQRGFWRQDGRGHYQIVQYLAHARSTEQILTDRAHNTADKARRAQHAGGDHSLCVDPRHCPAMAKAHAARDHSLCKDARFCKYLPKGSMTVPAKAAPAAPVAKRAAVIKATQVPKATVPKATVPKVAVSETKPATLWDRLIPYGRPGYQHQQWRMYAVMIMDGFAEKGGGYPMTRRQPVKTDKNGWEESGGLARFLDIDAELLEKFPPGKPPSVAKPEDLKIDRS